MVMPIKPFLIFLQATGTVPHGMSIFTKDVRLFGCLRDGPHRFALGVGMFEPRIHRRIHIRDVRFPVALIMDETTWINRLADPSHFPEVISKTGLIAGLPPDD